jgi:hypothetical protein
MKQYPSVRCAIRESLRSESSGPFCRGVCYCSSVAASSGTPCAKGDQLSDSESKKHLISHGRATVLKVIVKLEFEQDGWIGDEKLA